MNDKTFKYVGRCGDWFCKSNNRRDIVRKTVRAAKSIALHGHTEDWWVEDLRTLKITDIGKIDRDGKNVVSELYPQFS